MEDLTERRRGRRPGLVLALVLAACAEAPRLPPPPRAVLGPGLARARAALSAPADEGARAAERLLALACDAPDADLRAGSLVALCAADRDFVVQRLAEHVPLERDLAVRVELARTLARFGNLAGAAELAGVAEARPALVALAADAGAASPEELVALWRSGDPERRLARVEPSPRRELELWLAIERLAGPAHAHAAAGLARSESWSAAPLASVLVDVDRTLAARAARCLAELGPRGLGGGPDLLLALDAPDVAADAATALGAIGYHPAAAELARCTEPGRPTALRVAALGALGALAVPETFDALAARLEASEPPEVRLAAAEAALSAEGRRGAARVALELLRQADEASAARAERALDAWLRRSARDDPRLRASLEAWDALATPPGLEPTAEEIGTRRARRGEALAPALAE